MGSISQLLLGEVLMIFSTSSFDSGLKQSIQGGIWALTSNSSGGPVLGSSNPDLTFDLLHIKKALK